MHVQSAIRFSFFCFRTVTTANASMCCTLNYTRSGLLGAWAAQQNFCLNVSFKLVIRSCHSCPRDALSAPSTPGKVVRGDHNGGTVED